MAANTGPPEAWTSRTMASASTTTAPSDPPTGDFRWLGRPGRHADSYLVLEQLRASLETFAARQPLQMVYGDGNTFLHNFTGSIDVIGHELTVRRAHATHYVTT